MKEEWKQKVQNRAKEYGNLLPSERINMIFSELRQKKGGNKSHDRIEAVVRFLDEIYMDYENIKKLT